MKVRACADMKPEVAAAQGKTFGVEAMPVDTLLARDDIDIVVNLTDPRRARRRCRSRRSTAGKHVFSEKPLAIDVDLGRKVVAEADKRKLMVGCAPDTFLGAGGRLSRKLIDDGEVGKILTGTAFLMSHGMEHWHPDPEFFFKQGGGPVLDVGVYYITALVNLLGPIARVHSIDQHRLSRSASSPPTARGRAIASRSRRRRPAWRCSSSRPARSSPSSRPGTSGSTAIRRSSSTARRARCACPIRISTAASWRRASRAATGIQHSSEAMPLGKPNWPAEAPRHANYRALGVADMVQAHRNRPRPPCERQARAARARGDGGGRQGRHDSDVVRAARPEVFKEADAKAVFAL